MLRIAKHSLIPVMLVGLLLVQPVSGLEFTDQPPSSVSVSLSSDYELTWEVDNTIEDVKIMSMPVTPSMAQCNREAIADLFSELQLTYLGIDELGSIDAISDNKLIIPAIETIGGSDYYSTFDDLSEDEKKGLYTASNDEKYICSGISVQIDDGSDIIESDVVAIKIYEDPSSIPGNERVANTVKSLDIMMLALIGVIFVIVMVGLYQARMLF